MQKKTFTFKLSDDGYYELLKYMPYFRKVYFFGIIGVFVISTVLFLYWNHAFQESAEYIFPSDVRIYIASDVPSSIGVWFIPCGTPGVVSVFPLPNPCFPETISPTFKREIPASKR